MTATITFIPGSFCTGEYKNSPCPCLLDVEIIARQQDDSGLAFYVRDSGIQDRNPGSPTYLEYIHKWHKLERVSDTSLGGVIAISDLCKTVDIHIVGKVPTETLVKSGLVWYNEPRKTTFSATEVRVNNRQYKLDTTWSDINNQQISELDPPVAASSGFDVKINTVTLELGNGLQGGACNGGFAHVVAATKASGCLQTASGEYVHVENANGATTGMSTKICTERLEGEAEPGLVVGGSNPGGCRRDRYYHKTGLSSYEDCFPTAGGTTTCITKKCQGYMSGKGHGKIYYNECEYRNDPMACPFLYYG